MLYDHWRRVAKEFASELALHDTSDGTRWSFGQLADEAERGDTRSPMVFPTGNGPEFILSLLRAWRCGIVACPLEPGQPPPELDQLPPDSIVHLKTTSATTGDPRLVAFTESQIAADPANLVPAMGMRRDWPNLAAISLCHSYGFSNLVLPLLLHGIPLILVKSALPEALMRAASTTAAATLAGVPALWKTWDEANAIPANIRLAISAGAPLPLSLEREIYRKHGVKIHNFYGSSECGGIAYDASPLPRQNAAGVGSPISNVMVDIWENNCVRVRGRAVAEGYWPRPDPRLQHGTFVTGDVGELRDGWLYLSGRIGDLINVAGRKVAPEWIERALAECPMIRECVVFAIPVDDGHRGETIIGCVTVVPGTTTEDLRRFASSRLEPWQLPRHWWLVDSLQTNNRGKLSRAQLRQQYLLEGTEEKHADARTRTNRV